MNALDKKKENKAKILDNIIDDVTSIMSVYKNDKVDWVEESILSILTGTKVPGEILIYCDGFIESSVKALINSYVENFPGLITLYGSSVNRGRAYARQFLLERAKGTFILLMDADDICLADRLELQYAHFIKNPDVDVLGGFIIEFSSGFPDRIRKTPLENEKIREMVKYAQPVNHVTLFAKKKSLIKVGGYLDAGNCEDFYLIARCVVAGLLIENIDKNLVKVRVEDGFVTRRQGWRIGLDEMLVIKYLWDRKHVNIFEFLAFGSYRFFVRTLPASLIHKLYSINRSRV